MSKKYELDYIINHLGEDREKYHGATHPPTYQTSNFVFPSISRLAEAFRSEKDHHLYTRGNNPTVQILRKKLAALEGTEDALVFSSGIAAMSMAIISQVQAGDHIICVNHPYSWTIKLLQNFLQRFDVEHTFVDGTQEESVRQAYRSNTKLLILESPNTMTFEVQNLEALSVWAKSKGITTVIDNSYSSPLFQRPGAFGVDLIVHSGTKYLNGHSDVVFGVICGQKAMLDRIFDIEYMNLGAILAPHEANLIIRGLRTLPIRMDRILMSTHRVFEFLRNHDLVSKIYYPGDPNHPQADIIAAQMSGAPGLLSLELKGLGREEITNFVEYLAYFKMAVSWGGHESLIIPMLAVHEAFPAENHRLPFNFVRLYIGLEEPEVLIQDLSTALDRVSPAQ